MPEQPEAAVGPEPRPLVLITGTGRSGTSTMSGTFHHLGLHVPGPYLGANESNPKGFFESRWAVRFHKAIAESAGINDFDGRPHAFDRAQAAITPAMREELRDFLRRRGEGRDSIVVKDPRSVWAQREWRAAAEDTGLRIRFVSMLRHPAEVVGSRATYYASDDEQKRRAYEIFSVGRWINNSLISERETRGDLRAFVSYPDLLTDWRATVSRLAEDLDLPLADRLTPEAEAAVDEFIDPALRRHAVTWADLDVPAELQDLAERTWDCLGRVAAAHGRDERASTELDDLAGRYERLFLQAAAIAHDAIDEARKDRRAAAATPAPTAPPEPPAPRSRVRAVLGRVRARLRP